jgi:hypothetical protein
MNKNNNDKTNNYFDSKFRDKSVLFIICIIIICLLPFILTRKPLLGIDFSETGDIGSTIGGIMGPFIAIIASYLTFIAFWVQFKANKKQTEQFDTQAKDVKLERFENKFYEMIKIQRDNVSEISINNGTVTNRKAFISMFLEVKCAFFVLKQLIDSGKIKHLTEEEAINISYITFFTGVGANSSKVAKYLLPNFNEKMLDIYFKELSKYQTEYLSFTLEQKKI